MLKAAFVRGAFLNNFEAQNFVLPKDISLRGFSSLYPIDSNIPFPLTRLPSIADLGQLPIVRAVPLYHQGIKYLSNRVLGDSQILFGLEKKLEGYDVVDTADPHYYYSYQAACLRQKEKIKKLIVTYCEIIPFNNESVARKKFIKYFTMKQADAFICHTELSKLALIQEGADESKINVVRLGVDLNRFHPHRHKSDIFTILFVGRLAEEKGIADLFEVFVSLKKLTKQNIRLHMVGDGPLKSWLSAKIKQANLEQYVNIKQVPYDQIHTEYQNADVFILPSKQTKTIAEQYGMVLLEAMASGLPIISTKVGAIPEVVGDSGILVEQSNIEALTKAVLIIMQSKNLRLQYQDKSHNRATMYFDSRKTAATIGTIYSRL